jgi:hypothetical protein
MYYNRVPDRIRVTLCPFDVASTVARGFGGTGRTYSNLKDLEPTDFSLKFAPEIQ